MVLPAPNTRTKPSATSIASGSRLDCQRVEVDEVWSFVYSKEKSVPVERRDDPIGSVWTWTAIDADTKLIPCWLVGERTYADARAFVSDLAMRMKYRIQLTSDGHRPYVHAVRYAFGNDVDYAVLQKLFGKDKKERAEATYSPAACIGTKRHVVSGDPERKHISTSYVERSNLTLRMGCRRFTRLTNAFSKKIENLAAAVSLHFMYYNFARPHQSLKGKTPAMAAGVSSHVWTIEEIVGLLSENERVKSN